MSNHKEHSLSYWKKRVRRAQDGLKKRLDDCQKRVEPMLPDILKSRFGGPVSEANVAQESQRLRSRLEKDALPDEDQLRSRVLHTLPNASPEKREKVFLMHKTKALEGAAAVVRTKFRGKPDR